MSSAHGEEQGIDPVTLDLAAWVAGLSFEDIPTEVLARLKSCLLDTLGCALYGSRQAWGRIAADVAVAQSGSTGLATIVGRRQRASPPDAALANGTSIHGFEIDDIHVASSLHPGSVAVPAVLAACGLRTLTGREFLTAMAAGYEAGIRLGICAGVRHSTSGYHVTGTVGPVAAAAAAARALGLDAVRATHAIGLGATQASGLYAARMGAMAKRFHAGRAAQSGVWAALLAENGFTGSTIAIEAPFGGFLSTLNGEFPPRSMLDRLGEHWETARVGLKAYAACASAHTSIDAVLALRGRGLRADNLKHLRIGMSKKGATNVGWTYVPGEIVAAQMNGYYAAAVALLDGTAFIDQYSPERLADPRILDVISRIEIAHDPELDAGGAAKRHAVNVKAALSDGSRLVTYVEQRKGSFEHPLSPEEITTKFKRLATSVVSPAATEIFVDLVADLEQQQSVSVLLAALSSPSS